MRLTNQITTELLVILLVGSACQPLAPSALDPPTTVSVPVLGPVSLPQNPAGRYAFVDVNVLTMENEAILPHQTVLVEGRHITALGPVAQIDLPPGATVINGAGRYLLPGLADMHVHLRKEYYLLLFLLNGVTTVRNMDGRPEHLAWRAQIANGQLLGPTIITTGPVLDQPNYGRTYPPPSITQKEALHIVADQKQQGYDAIKVYDGLSVSSYYNLVRAADIYNMTVVGHVPDGLQVLDVIEAGQRSIEHLDGYFNFYADQVHTLLNSLVIHQTWTSPVLACFQLLKPTGEPPAGLQRSMLTALPNLTAMFPYLPSDYVKRGYAYAPISPLKRQRIRQLAEAGAPMLLGTDAPIEYAIPGFAAHQELQNLVDAGLTPYAALRIATYNAALFIDQLEEVGTVTVGKRTDLLLVEANPLTDVANTRQIAGVMVQGRWLPQRVLLQWLRQAAAQDT